MKVEELPAIELRRLCLAMSSEELIKAIILLYVSDWDVIILFAPLMTKGQVLDLRVLYDRLLQQKVFYFFWLEMYARVVQVDNAWLMDIPLSGNCTNHRIKCFIPATSCVAMPSSRIMCYKSLVIVAYA